ncbi:MAG: VWA domain-containing protein [Bryobacterales bacterium]|nr:VWA domain-containing protein [Bryobacterales bacterium]
MFDFFFNYPAPVFSKGKIVLLGSWPVWVLILLILGGAALLGYAAWQKRNLAAGRVRGMRLAAIWALQAAMLALLLLMLWQPALSVATLKPQQNIVAVVLDDSKSMSLVENGASRKQQVLDVLNKGMLADLQKKFQVRLYRFDGKLERIEKLDELKAEGSATRIGDNLAQVVAESATLPIGAVVLMSDGADNSGGIDLDTLNLLKRQRIPVHAVGVGREKFDKDIEVTDVQLAPRALEDSRVSAAVTVKQRGYDNAKARITVKSDSSTLTSQEITLKSDGALQTEAVVFNTGSAGLKNLRVAVEPLAQEENPNNNSVSRIVNVENRKPRILYIEGEPKWEFKFVRRAVEEDRSLTLATIIRTTQNKIYRQGINNPAELEQGFPSKVEELFGYQGIIVGGVEAGYFSVTQMEILKQFVDRRGGGLLFMAGRGGLSEGGWGRSAMAEMLPVVLPDRKSTFRRDPALVELTQAGRDSLICRLEENPEKNVERWKKLPQLADYQDAGTPKPGALTLVDALPSSGGKLPLLVTQNYGRGRVGVFATQGSWRWQMLQPVADKSHEMFWQQLLRWLVQDTPGRVIALTPKPVLADETKLVLRADVRDKNYLPAADAKVTANVIGPGGAAEQLELSPDPLTPGAYVVEWRAEKTGAYVAEVLAKRGEEEMGRDVVNFRREDGVAEYFGAEQNRELLEKLAAETAGAYYPVSNLAKLSEQISYSEAGISMRETKDLWNMPAFFLLLLLMRAGEWLLRRKWGVV